MTEQFLNDAYQNLLDQLDEMKNNSGNRLKHVTTALGQIKESILGVTAELKDFVFNDDFTEVTLHKHWMVKFYALFIYETESFRITDGLPKGTEKVVRKYYSEFVRDYSSYFKEHAFWYGYFRNNLDMLDVVLFSGSSADILFLPESPDFFGAGFPACSYIFARFMAYERLVAELNLKLNPADASISAKTYTHGLQWTGNKVNVAELAYGLYYAGQFNNGNAEVTDIYKWLEESLGISMGSVHRKFIDLRRRNTASPTKLLDKMRESIHQRIDEDLKYKPNRGIKLNRPVNED